MKTSYKIITAFLIIIFTTLLTINISLKNKYKNGDFNIPKEQLNDIFTQGDLDKQKLADFKHVVINGAIITKNGRQVKFYSNISISSGNLGNVLGLEKKLSSMLRKHISNDTLYISFQKNNINENNLKRTYFQQIILQAKDLRSVSIENLNCDIEFILSGKPFSVNAETSKVFMNYIKTNLLTLNIGKQCDINFNGYSIINQKTTASKVDMLNYKLAKGSTISISNKELIGKINCLTPSKDIIEDYSKSLTINHNGNFR